jgi:hypothetical protein
MHLANELQSDKCDVICITLIKKTLLLEYSIHGQIPPIHVDVRPTLEYTNVVWAPAMVTNMQRLEAVQRQSAKSATRGKHQPVSVNALVEKLGWQTL